MATTNATPPGDFEITVTSSPPPEPRPRPPPLPIPPSTEAGFPTAGKATTTRKTSVTSPRSAPQRPPFSAPPRGNPDVNMSISSGFFNPFKRHLPWMVPGFVLANIVLFLLTMYENNCPKTSATGCLGANFLGRFSFLPLKDNPLLGPASPALDEMGALIVAKVVTYHQVWRLFTCIWLHAGVFHLVANMLSLLIIGIQLEQEFGSVRTAFLYVLSGFGGSLTSSLFIQEGISVGASGALFGLLGAMLSELFTNWTIYANKLAALLTTIVIIGINLAVGVLPKVDNFAHIGGFVYGFLLGFVILIRPQFGWVSQKKAPPGYMINCPKSKHKPYQYAFCVIALILLIAGYTLGLILLLRGGNLRNHCSWCRYLSCVPTPWWNCKAQQLYCQSSQMGSQLNMTCTSNGKSRTYTMMGDNQFNLQQLCARLCS